MNVERHALYPGSFDPVTLGHEDIARLNQRPEMSQKQRAQQRCNVKPVGVGIG